MPDLSMPFPVLYLPHGGGPLPLLGEAGHAGLVRFLRNVGGQLPRPKAILMVSAHWETPAPRVTAAPNPPMLYDYFGFPEAAYEIEYPAPGCPELAARVRAVLGQAGIECDLDAERGFDHGMFVPLKLMYPDADVPCVQLSLYDSLDPRVHIALGEALAPLRGESVFIVGSGLSFHNMGAFGAASPDTVAAAGEFTDWLDETCAGEALAVEARTARLAGWAKAPQARFCHPREDHLLPLHVCFGAAAAATEQASVVFDETLLGHRAVGLLWQ